MSDASPSALPLRLSVVGAAALLAAAFAASCTPAPKCDANETAVAGVCVCNAGFTDQTGKCEPVVAPDAGTPAPDAGTPDAGEVEPDPCLPNGELGEFGCDCVDGFVGTVDSCVEDDEDGCGVHGRLVLLPEYEVCDCSPGSFEDHWACTLAPACEGTDDAAEPNDRPTDPTEWSRATPSVQGYVCPGNQDWYAFTLAAGETIAITVNLTHEDGDLDLKLYSGAEPDPLTTEWVAESYTEEDVEQITFVAETAGVYLLNVYGYREAEGAYTLGVTFSGP